MLLVEFHFITHCILLRFFYTIANTFYVDYSRYRLIFSLPQAVYLVKMVFYSWHNFNTGWIVCHISMVFVSVRTKLCSYNNCTMYVLSSNSSSLPCRHDKSSTLFYANHWLPFHKSSSDFNQIRYQEFYVWAWILWLKLQSIRNETLCFF